MVAKVISQLKPVSRIKIFPESDPRSLWNRTTQSKTTYLTVSDCVGF